jgi:hypothetical protein
MVAYALFHLGVNYVLTHKVAEKDAAAMDAIRAAEVSQKKFFDSHGRYYAVGPVRGPYKDEHGLSVKKDVVLQVIPVYDKEVGREAYRAYAVHVWGRTVAHRDKKGRVDQAPPDSKDLARMREKLIRSVQ